MSDMSELWYREFYLELTRCIQFPIEMSVPWILTELVLTDKNVAPTVPTADCLLYILDIYNDAAQSALYSLGQQYLYEEVEAEANLVLDQLVYLLSDEIYAHYKVGVDRCWLIGWR